MNKHFNLLPLLVFIIIFWVVFSGDAGFYDVQIFPFLTFFMLIIIAFLKIEIPKQSLFVHVYFFSLVICFFSSFLADYSYFYNFWVVKTFIGYLALLFCMSIIENNKEEIIFCKNIFILSVLVLLIFVFGMFINGNDRGSFIFGPNILYRVFGVLSILSLIYLFFIKSKINRFFILITLSCVLLFGILLTGSRGGIPIFLIVIFAFYHAFVEKIKFTKMSIIFILVSLISIYLFYTISENINLSSTRFTNFDFEGNKSLATRMSAWFDFFQNPIDWIISNGRTYNEFMLLFGNVENGYSYPHNLFLELIFFNGIYGFFLTLIMIFTIIYYFFIVISSEFSLRSIVFYISVIVFVGGMFSGNLQDNFSIISLFMLLHMVRNEKFNS